MNYDTNNDRNNNDGRGNDGRNNNDGRFNDGRPNDVHSNAVSVFIKKIQAKNYGTGNPIPASESQALNAEWATIKSGLPANEQAAAEAQVRQVLVA